MLALMPKATPEGKICGSPQCAQAGKVQPLAAYSRNRSSADGLETYCIKCRRLKQKVRRARYAAGVDTDALPTPPVSTPSFRVPPPPPLPPLEAAYAKAEESGKASALRTEHRALLTENTKLKEQLAEMLKAARPPSVIVYDKAAHLRSDAVACALGSDWHVEEPVAASTVHGLNEYSLDIAKARAERFFQNLLKLAVSSARDRNITTIWLGLLGDLFTGWLHEENLANNTLAPGDAAHFVVELLTSGVAFLLKEGPFNLLIDALPGNHGRMTKKMHHGNPTGTSLETFAYHQVASHFHTEKRVHIDVATQAMVYRDFFESFKMRLIHGYEVNYGGGVGGLTIPLRKALAQWNNPIRAQLTCLGHFHQLISMEDFVVNGSMIGYSQYSQTIKATYEPPRQAFFLIDARNGGEKTVSAPIHLEGKK